MKHYLTYKDNKFWNIEISGKSFTVTYGETGTVGISQIETFDTKEKCLKKAQKLLSEKLKKGYVEINPPKKGSPQIKADYLKEWQAIVDSEDLHKALINHFSYLADTPGYDKILQMVMNQAVKATIGIPEYQDEKTLIIEFPGKNKLFTYAPAKEKGKKYSRSFQKILNKSSLLRTEGTGEFYLGIHNMFESEWFENLDSELLEYVKPEQIITPLYYNSDVWLFHPKEKNQFGEPVIYFFAHDGGGECTDPEEVNAGALFLKLIAEAWGIKIEMPIHTKNKNDAITEEWWNNLDSELKEAVENEPYVSDTDSLSKKIQLVEHLYVNENSKIKSLESISKFVNLSSFDCDAPHITDISTISSWKKLSYLRISSKKVKDFSPLKNVIKLKKLILNDTKINDLSPLTSLSNLNRLELEGTLITDLQPLAKLKNLEYLQISGTSVKNIEPIISLGQLRTLKIQGTHVKDISRLKELKYLSDLDISDTKIDSFDVLKSLPRLTKFYANNTSLPNLESLMGSKSIARVHCKGTLISKKEIEGFKKSIKPRKDLGLEIDCDFFEYHSD
ncbi:WGR domain-containing protein [Leptospira weilii]|uniref:WGR domain-containing protein n=1 Tax=Leptospira weilii TaxID=28184 RepID=UPI00055CFE2F|nr:WGR domain-containing protein [Leptospira weilii]